MELYYDTLNNGEINLESVWIDKMIRCVEKSAYFITHQMMNQYNKLMWQ